MKKWMFLAFLASLSFSVNALATTTYVASEVDFYVPNYPGALNMQVYSPNQTDIMVCKITTPPIVACTIQIPSSGIITPAAGGDVGFSNADKSSYCDYSLYADYDARNNTYVFDTVTLEYHDMNCDASPDPTLGNAYKVDY